MNAIPAAPAGTPDQLPCDQQHFTLGACCTLPAAHTDWHETNHPDSGARLRFRTLAGARHTQEWLPDDDRELPGEGRWVTWHYLADGEPTPLVVADLDRRAASYVSGHYPTGQTRAGAAGAESQCACGEWYPAGQETRHLGRQVSILARMYFDGGLEAAARAAKA